MMKIFGILTKTSPSKVFGSLLLGTVAGIGYAFLIPIVLYSFESNGPFLLESAGPVSIFSFEVSNIKFAALFLLSCLLILGARTLSQLILTWVALDTTSALRVKFYRKILNAPITSVEKTGSAKLIASITTDVRNIIQGAQLLPDMLISLVTITGMLLFLLYLNSNIFYFVCGGILFGVITFQLPMAIAGKFFRKSREKVDDLQEGIKGIIRGIKALKLCKTKRDSYMSEVMLESEKEVLSAGKKGATIIRSASNYGDMLSFFVVGFVAFVFVNYHAISLPELMGAVMVLLYITGPISIMLNAIPQVIVANISLKKVSEIFDGLKEEQISPTLTNIPEWKSIQFSNVTYQYETQNQAKGGFSISPLNFTLAKGEITFIIGGNGSGKSTLGKLITSHYLPTSGQISLGDLLIDETNINSYRNQISAITSDYYLFDRLLGNSNQNDDELINTYLAKLQIDSKVSLKNGHFSSLSLSDGQRKRLALLVSFLEDKAIYVFDEWAADQDPEFKQVFYWEILPYLKEKGKAVVVISHDDRYFDVADKVLVMEQGVMRHLNQNDQQQYFKLSGEVENIKHSKTMSEDSALKEYV
ncbi:cyclic peptide export ABC transporter [Aliikangiella sp. IMCC44359]|uniref:cyclic peptide export ABC transporter n=1 Tax=Aliikangiella sp. IMCC44359 TaxID=3459125 RepID=UPI00403A80DF